MSGNTNKGNFISLERTLQDVLEGDFKEYFAIHLSNGWRIST